MNIDLDHDDIVSLVMGQNCPAYELLDTLEKGGCGHYTGGFRDDWTWNRDALEKMDDMRLLLIYQTCKAASQATTNGE